jgi:hypothetical protein
MNKIYNSNDLETLAPDIMFNLNNPFSDWNITLFILSDDYDDVIIHMEDGWDT